MVSGVGLGFRRDLKDFFLQDNKLLYTPAFVEVAPENWIDIGGYWKNILFSVAERYPMLAHGLSLSLGSPEPLDIDLLLKIKQFLEEYNISIYSEHLSFCKCDNAHLYDLLPIPFCEESILFVAKRIKQAQEILERKIAIENVSYYTPIDAKISEDEFIKAIVQEADCDLLLDVNNVYVNAFNHGYSSKDFILSLPLEKVAYIHMAGHTRKKEDLIIDTHGEAIIDPVYKLFSWTCQYVKDVPILLERDFNFPHFSELEKELATLNALAEKEWKNKPNDNCDINKDINKKTYSNATYK